MVSAAAAITPADVVLEPSAGTGLLAILAELSGASLVLNELAETRAELLSLLFPGITVTRFDAAHIDDHLDTGIKPKANLLKHGINDFLIVPVQIRLGTQVMVKIVLPATGVPLPG